MIDTHAHLNLKQFDRDRLEVLRACEEMDLEVINVGIDHASSVAAVGLSKRPGCYASVGLHPSHLGEEVELCQPLMGPGVVAIGETGLDFYRRPGKREKERQQDLFCRHGQTAREHGYPLIMHCRMAFPELVALLRSELAGCSGVVHSFSGSLALAGELLNMGYYLGLSGLVFKLDLDEVIRSTPLDRILIETDSPFLPPPSSGEKRNTPAIGWRPVLEKVAFVKKIPASEVAKAATDNAVQLFQLEKHGRVPTPKD